MKSLLLAFAVLLAAFAPAAHALDVAHYKSMALDEKSKDPLTQARTKLALTGYFQALTEMFQVMQTASARISPAGAPPGAGICLPAQPLLQLEDIRSLVDAEISGHAAEYASRNPDWETASIASLAMMAVTRRYPCTA